MNAVVSRSGTAVRTNTFTRRGACPALSAPMRTGDGLLVRLNPVAGGLSPNTLMGLCKAALRHGNGVMEVTARGSLQIRGLTLGSAVSLAAEVDALGIAVRTGVPVQTGALAGLDPDEVADPRPLAEGIRAAIEAAGLEGRLGPKVSVVVDGGGNSGLDEITADVRLTAARNDPETLWRIAVAGDAETALHLGSAKEGPVLDAAIAVLSSVAAMGVAARARDLTAEQLDDVARGMQRSSKGAATGPEPAKTLMSLGISPLLDDRYAVGMAVPFGQTGAENLTAFAERAKFLGVTDIRLAPKRTIFALCPSDTSAQMLHEAAERLGFVVSPSDRRAKISACPGAPACASGYIAARDLAAEIASENNGLLDSSLHLHVSGCAKGCAHPGKSGLTIVGSENGAGLVVNGTARDAPLAYTARDGARAALGNVAGLVREERRPGEDPAAALDRLDGAKISEVFAKQ